MTSASPTPQHRHYRRYIDDRRCSASSSVQDAARWWKEVAVSEDPVLRDIELDMR